MMKGYPKAKGDLPLGKVQETEVPLRLYVGVILLTIGLILYFCTS